MAAFGRERIDDPRQLVGERHRGQLELVLDGLALEQSARPAAQGVVMPLFRRSSEKPFNRGAAVIVPESALVNETRLG